MKINEYNFANHQHLDAGAFQIYYRGALAIDSGLYSGSSGQYGSPHCRNYYWRTIAHNSLLVYDPQEQFSTKGDYANDGGQRLPNDRSEPKTLEMLLAPEKGHRTGKVLSHGFGPDPQKPHFTFLQGDITDAYSRKVKQVTLSFVFLNLHNTEVPAALVVFDHVISSNPAFRKYWLIHSLEEPAVQHTGAVIDRTQYGATGRLVLNVLLPQPDNMLLGKVGGPGKEFWVFGTNYANNVKPEMLERSSMEPGSWRLEISPKSPAAEDFFLNVLQVTDRKTAAHLPVRRFDTDERTGCLIEGTKATWAVIFRRDNVRSAQPIRFFIPGSHPCRILVTDLAPGIWHAQHTGSAETLDIDVTEHLGAAWLEGPAGNWILSR